LGPRASRSSRRGDDRQDGRRGEKDDRQQAIHRAHRIRLRGRLVLGEDDQPAGALGEALEHR
jgi:hypothetical protein